MFDHEAEIAFPSQALVLFSLTLGQAVHGHRWQSRRDPRTSFCAPKGSLAIPIRQRSRRPAQWSLGSATRCTMSSYRAPGTHWAWRLRDTEAAPCLLEVTAQKGNTSQRLGPVLASSLSC